MAFLNLQWSPNIPQVSLFIYDPLLGLLQLPVPTLSLSVTMYDPPPLFFVFLGPHLWHMEVPRLGVELELQLPD